MPTMTAAELNAAIANGSLKFKRLPTAHGSKSNHWADRIKGGSSRVRTGAGSRSVHQSTKASALMDVL